MMVRRGCVLILILLFAAPVVAQELDEGSCVDQLSALVESLQRRPWIGLEFHYLEVEPNVNRFLVSRVQQDGPASQAGLRRGDVILTINGARISDLADHAAGKETYQREFASMQRGVPMRLSVERDSETFQTDLVPGTPEGYALAEVVGQRLLMQQLGMVIATDHRDVHQEAHH